MRLQPLALVAVALCLIAMIAFGADKKAANIPKDGFVPNEETAIRIAIAVWIPIFGEKQIMQERPFTAKLENDIWTVSGSVPKDSLGGAAKARISKSDGRIVEVYHDA